MRGCPTGGDDLDAVAVIEIDQATLAKTKEQVVHQTDGGDAAVGGDFAQSGGVSVMRFLEIDQIKIDIQRIVDAEGDAAGIVAVVNGAGVGGGDFDAVGNLPECQTLLTEGDDLLVGGFHGLILGKLVNGEMGSDNAHYRN